MWPIFCADVAFALVFLYLPGFLLLSLCRIQTFIRFAVAPIFSSVSFYMLAYLYSLIDIDCNWATLCLPIFVAVIILLILKYRYVTPRKYSLSLEKINIVSVDVRTVVVYLLVAICVAVYFFVRTLDGPASFYQENDNIYHLTLVRDFLDSGTYALSSILSYPAAWHVLVAIVASVMGGSEVTIAVNAVNFVLLAFVTPLSILLFLAKVFANSKQIVVWGSLCSLGFASYPWGFLVFGPLYPNLFAYVMLPAAMALFMFIFAKQKRETRVIWILLFLISCCSLAVAHPNSIFVGIVILVPYCVSLIAQKKDFSIKKRTVCGVGFVLFVSVVWLALYLSPMFSGVVSFEWSSYLTRFQAIVGNLMISYTKASVPQLMMAFLIICGVTYSLIKKRHRWLVWSYGILFVMQVVTVSSDGTFKHLLTGFWYTDEFRVAAALSIAGIPVATIGLYAISKMLLSVVKTANNNKITKYEINGLAVALACVFCLVNYMPSFLVNQFGSVVTGFGSVNTMLTNGNSLEENVAGFDKEEIAFSKEVKQLIGDEKVFNFPYDGSAYAYAVADLNVENKAWYGYEGLDEDPEGALLRLGLNTVSNNEAIQQLLNDKQIKYVLMLDQGNISGSGLYDAACDYELWTGVTSISDSTPSFKIVLSSGDMRLYEIVDAD